jgi:hypothetical protein
LDEAGRLSRRGGSMTLEQVALISEIMGSIATVVALVYLAIQIKDGARASRSAAVTDATAAMQAFYQELGSNPEACKLFLNGLTKPDALSREDQYQWLMLMHSCFLGFQVSYFLAREGTLDVALRDSVATAMRATNHLPGPHFYWRQRKAFFQPEFARWVEGLLAGKTLADMDVFRARSDTPSG